MPMCSSCRGRGFGEPASEPVFSVVPAIMLGKNIYIWGQAPVRKTKSLHRLTEPHTDNSLYMLYTYIHIMQFILFTRYSLYSVQYMLFL